MAQLLLIIAEDDHFMREWLAITLEALDATMLQATNGHELAHLLSARREVDLVISDIRMPGPSGVEVLARARRKGIAVPFIFITGYGAPDVIGTAEELGAAVLQKPFSRRDLLARIDLICPVRSAGVR
jgi:DNA-binding response OmpR family regulator